MIFSVLYLIVAVLVISLILLQGRGAGLGSAWGGTGETFSTRRGVERLTFNVTVGLTTLFFLMSVINLLL